MAAYNNKKIGELLIESGLITERDCAFVLSEKHRNEPFIEAVCRLGLLSPAQEQQAWKILAAQLGIPYLVSGVDFFWEPALAKILDSELAVSLKVLPVKSEGDVIWIGTCNPFDIEALETVRVATKMRVKQVFLSPQDCKNGMDILYKTSVCGYEGEIPFVVESLDMEIEEPALLDKPAVKDFMGLEEAPVFSGRMDVIDLDQEEPGVSSAMRMFRSMLKRAVFTDSSDIHIEPGRDDGVVRYRIDGVLHEMSRMQMDTFTSLITTIKVMASMDIAEKRLPQDGRFSATLAGQEIDFRVSTLPTVYGEKVVLRLLRRGTGLLRLDRLGLDKGAEAALMESIKALNGLILITGPTGSGKSTTLYALLRELDLKHLNVITIEDPVEYQMTGINQINIRSDIGLTFASVLRAALRQDPDVIMVGEIRDVETADMAIRASLTGHLVFATLHTNSAPATIDRLLDMGVEPYLLGSALRFIGAQRLVRRLCQDCRVETQPPEHLLYMLPDEETVSMKFYRGEGCLSCNGTGFKGRIALLEYIKVDAHIARLLAGHAKSDEIRNAAAVEGLYTSLLRPALLALRDGVTTLDEVARVLTSI